MPPAPRSWVRNPTPPPPLPAIWSWRDDALCAEPQYAGLLWFPTEQPDKYRRQKGRHEALRVCGLCRVRVECGRYADSIEGICGIWGGVERFFWDQYKEVP